MNPLGGVESSGSAGTAHGVGGMSIRDEGKAPTQVSKGSNMGKGHTQTTMGETGKFDKTGIPKGAPPSGAEMDSNSDSTKRGRGVQRYRVSGSYLEYLCIHI